MIKKVIMLKSINDVYFVYKICLFLDDNDCLILLR